MTSNDLPALFAACIERTETGEYKNPDARERLADVAGKLVGLYWYSPNVEIEGEEWTATDETNISDAQCKQWADHGRLAPLVSLDAANSIKMPEGWTLGWDEFRKRVAVYDQRSDFDFGFAYTDPADRATAECAARVYANLRAREDGHE